MITAALRKRLCALLERLAPGEGYTLTHVPAVRLLRSDRPLARTPVLYEPGIVIVCQGRKRGYFGGRLYLYDEQHYLAVSVPVPFTMETEASAQRPLLALYVRLDRRIATEVAMLLAEHGREAVDAPQSMSSSPMSQPLAEAVMRLLECCADPLEAAVLGEARLRDLYYRVLVGEQGATLRQALVARGVHARVHRAIRRIHADYARRLTVGELAREADLGAAAFHAHFKAVTQASPMQYLKSTRLHQARLLMVRQSMTAAAAGARVGYESPSQFSREFKRLFGRTPVLEAERMRQGFALPEQEDSGFVSSH